MGNWSIGGVVSAILIAYVIISFFTEYEFILVRDSRSSKAKDFAKYYPLAEAWLIFPDGKKFVPDYSSYYFGGDVRHQFFDAVNILNPLLPKHYQISTDLTDTDYKNFMIIFQEYQKVLCYKFFDRNYFFSTHYENYFSHKNKKEKIWHPEALEEIWNHRGRDAERNIFFAETLFDFLNNALDYHSLAGKDFFIDKDGEQFLSDFGGTAYKVYLSALLVKEKLGYTMGNISFIKSMLEAAVEQ